MEGTLTARLRTDHAEWGCEGTAGLRGGKRVTSQTSLLYAFWMPETFQ